MPVSPSFQAKITDYSFNIKYKLNVICVCYSPEAAKTTKPAAEDDDEDLFASAVKSTEKTKPKKV